MFQEEKKSSILSNEADSVGKINIHSLLLAVAVWMLWETLPKALVWSRDSDLFYWSS